MSVAYDRLMAGILSLMAMMVLGCHQLSAAESNDSSESSEASTNAATDVVGWQPGDSATAIAGLIPAPADLPGVGRWQAMMMPVASHVESAVFNPEGTRVAFGDGQYVRIHDANTLDITGVLVGNAANVRSVAWSPNGEWIASGGDDATVRIWRADGIPAGVLEGHLAPVKSVTWHPDSQSLASAGLDGTIRLWSIDGAPGQVIEGHEAPVNTVDWSPDGRQLAAGDENRTVRIWSVDGTPGPVLEGHHGAITRVRWSPDGEWLASTSMGLVPTEPSQQAIATTRLWQASGPPGPILSGHSRGILGLAWSPDSQQLITASEDRSILLWSREGERIRELDDTRNTRRDTYTLDWNASTGRIVAAGRNSIRFLSKEGRIGSTRLVRPDGSHLFYLDWSPAGDQITIGSDDSQIYLWSKGFVNEKTIDAFENVVGVVRWSPDGKEFAAISFEDVVRVFNADGTLNREVNTASSRGVPRWLEWTRDGQRLAVAKRYGQTLILDRNGDTLSFDFHGNGSSSVSFNPDGTRLATGGFDANVRVVDVADLSQQPKELALLQAYDGDVDSVAWSPDGEWIATGHTTTLCFWKPDGTPGPVVPASEASIMRIDWSPDSQTLVTGSWDKSVLLWNREGELVREFPSHLAPVWGTSFSPDGKQLATCGWDGLARVLDVETGDILATAVYVADPTPDAEVEGTPPHFSVAFNRAGQVTSGRLDILEEQFAYLVEQPSGAIKVLKPSEFRDLAPGAILSQSDE